MAEQEQSPIGGFALFKNIYPLFYPLLRIIFKYPSAGLFIGELTIVEI